MCYYCNIVNVPVRVGPVLDFEHEQYDEHDDDERGGRDEHYERRALGRLRVDRRLGVFGRRRFGRRRERFTAEHHVWRGHHRLAVAFVVTAGVTVTAAVFVTAAALAARFHVILLVVAVEERRVRRGAGGTRGGDDHGSGARAGRLFVAAGRTARRVRHRGRCHGHCRTGRPRVRGRFRRGGRGGRRPVRLRLVSGRHRGAHCRPRICLVRRMLSHPCGSVDGRRRPVGRHHRM